MNRQCELSNVTRNYLEEFRCILDKMIKGMTEAELCKSISYNFIVQMIPHHRAAIEMSRNLLKYTTNISLQNIAMNIISEQTKSIQNMDNIICCSQELCNSDKELCCYQQKTNCIIETMFSKMNSAPESNCIDCNFMAEMIPHHMGAVEMSENALKYPIYPGLKPILKAIITSQKRGIAQMRNIYQCIGC